MLKDREITGKIIKAAFEVHNVLGYGFLEKVYQKSMQIELCRLGMYSELEPKIQIKYKNEIVGNYAADLLVENKVIVELKVSKEYNSSDEAQLLNELKGGEVKLGILINFGREKVEFKRMIF